MINHRQILPVFVILVAICLVTQQAAALNLYDSNYTSEVYATFSSSGLGRMHDITFDSQGDLYVSFWGSSRDVADGAIHRIDQQGVSSLFASGFYYPAGMVWSKSTEYGNNLYVADAGTSYGSGGGIKRVDINGGITHIASPSNQPFALDFDTTGNYGNRLYTGTRGLDHIDAILPDGTIQRFSDFPYNMSGGPASIDFDLTGSYADSMYIANDGSSSYSGIYKMDTLGNAERFAPDITSALCLDFDTSSDFNGDMFVSGKQDSDTYWTVYQISPDQDVVKFADLTGSHLTWFEFGPDGALYVLENNGTTAVINRITPVPEPASILVLLTGALLMKRRKRN